MKKGASFWMRPVQIMPAANLLLAAEIRREDQELVADVLAPSLGNEGILKVVVVVQFQGLGTLGSRENQNLAAEAFRVKTHGIASHNGAAVFTRKHGSDHQGILPHGTSNTHFLVIVTLAHDVGNTHFTGGQGLTVVNFTVGSNGGTAGRSLNLGVEVAFGNRLIAQKLTEIVIGSIALKCAQAAHIIMLGNNAVGSDVIGEIAQFAVGFELVHRHAHVLHVGQGLHLVAFVDLVQDRTICHGSQQGDNGNDNQEFNQGKPPA